MTEPRGVPLTDVALYFLLTVVLTAPFWLAGAFSGLMLMPGLPLAGLAVVCPAAAALVLTLVREGPAGGGRLLRRVFDGGRVRPAVWWLAILGVTPAVGLAAFAVLRLGGSAVPDPQISASALVLFAVFLIGGACEELGWTGFALEPLRARWGVLGAGLIIGTVWAAWHYPALLQAGRSAGWIAWWTLGTLGLRLVMTWLYEHAGRSVLAIAVFHAMSNLSWQLFPVRGSWYDPRLQGLLMAAVVVVLYVVRRPPRPVTP